MACHTSTRIAKMNIHTHAEIMPVVGMDVNGPELWNTASWSVNLAESSEKCLVSSLKPGIHILYDSAFSRKYPYPFGGLCR